MPGPVTCFFPTILLSNRQAIVQAQSIHGEFRNSRPKLVACRRAACRTAAEHIGGLVCTFSALPVSYLSGLDESKLGFFGWFLSNPNIPECSYTGCRIISEILWLAVFSGNHCIVNTVKEATEKKQRNSILIFVSNNFVTFM